MPLTNSWVVALAATPVTSSRLARSATSRSLHCALRRGCRWARPFARLTWVTNGESPPQGARSTNHQRLQQHSPRDRRWNPHSRSRRVDAFTGPVRAVDSPPTRAQHGSGLADFGVQRLEPHSNCPQDRDQDRDQDVLDDQGQDCRELQANSQAFCCGPGRSCTQAHPPALNVVEGSFCYPHPCL